MNFEIKPLLEKILPKSLLKTLLVLKLKPLEYSLQIMNELQIVRTEQTNCLLSNNKAWIYLINPT
jgi:hypothetical protein